MEMMPTATAAGLTRKAKTAARAPSLVDTGGQIDIPWIARAVGILEPPI
jgi:hypothetical protein